MDEDPLSDEALERIARAEAVGKTLEERVFALELSRQYRIETDQLQDDIDRLANERLDDAWQTAVEARANANIALEELTEHEAKIFALSATLPAPPATADRSTSGLEGEVARLSREARFSRQLTWLALVSAWIAVALAFYR